MNGKLHVFSRREAYKGRFLTVTAERVELPNGHSVELDIVRHPGAAAVVAIDAEDNVVFVRQIRHAAGGWLMEIPAGKLDHGEAPEVCAARELAEEAGYRAAKLEPLGYIWTTPGFTDERIWLYLATELTPVAQALEVDEVLTIEKLPLEVALARAASGEIDDAKSVCALFRAAKRYREGRALI